MAQFFKEQRKFLNRLGRRGVKDLKNKLIKLDKVASGRTVNSINYRTKFTLTQSSVSVLGDKAIVNINDGRGAGLKHPPPDVIEDWILDRGMRLQLKDGTPVSLKTLGFLIGRSIAENGIEPTNVIDKVFNRKAFQNFVLKGLTKTGGDDIKTRTFTLAKEV